MPAADPPKKGKPKRGRRKRPTSPKPPPSAAAQDHVARVLGLLRASIRLAGRSQTDVDEAIGRRLGYLSHVFQRRVDLKLVDLLRALEVLDVEPRRFFTAAFSDVPAAFTVSLAERPSGSPAHASREVEEPDLEARVRRALVSLLRGEDP